MNCLLFYNGNDPAFSIWNNDINGCMFIADAMKKDGWNVVWTVHSTASWHIYPGYETAYTEWKKLS